MTNDDIPSIAIERAQEQLRQERATFDLRCVAEARWFRLRLVMGYSSVVLMVSVMAVATYILVGPRTDYPTSTLAAAGAALFVDVVGLLVSIWKIVLNPTFMSELAPVTQVPPSEFLSNTENTIETSEPAEPFPPG